MTWVLTIYEDWYPQAQLWTVHPGAPPKEPLSDQEQAPSTSVLRVALTSVPRSLPGCPPPRGFRGEQKHRTHTLQRRTVRFWFCPYVMCELAQVQPANEGKCLTSGSKGKVTSPGSRWPWRHPEGSSGQRVGMRPSMLWENWQNRTSDKIFSGESFMNPISHIFSYLEKH